MLNTMVQLQGLRPIPARNPEISARRRREFMAAAQAPAKGQAKSAADASPTWWQGVVATLSGLFNPSAPHPVPVGLLALLLVFIVAGMLGTFGVTQAAAALPGEILYPVKTATENAAFLLARDPETRDALLQGFAEERRLEAAAIRDLKRPVQRMQVQGVIEQMGDGEWRVNNLPIIITGETVSKANRWSAPTSRRSSAPPETDRWSPSS